MHPHAKNSLAHLKTQFVYDKCGNTQIEEVEDKKPSKDEKVSAVKTVETEEEALSDKEAEKLATPDEKPKKRRSIDEKKPKKQEPEKIEPSVDEPDHIQVDTVNENDLKPSSKPSSRRGSKKETSPEPKTIEVQTLLAATEMAFFKSFSPIYVIQLCFT